MTQESNVIKSPDLVTEIWTLPILRTIEQIPNYYFRKPTCSLHPFSLNCQDGDKHAWTHPGANKLNGDPRGKFKRTLVHCGYPWGKGQGIRGEKDKQGDGEHPKEIQRFEPSKWVWSPLTGTAYCRWKFRRISEKEVRFSPACCTICHWIFQICCKDYLHLHPRLQSWCRAYGGC